MGFRGASAAALSLLMLTPGGRATTQHAAQADLSRQRGTVISVEPLGSMDQPELKEIAAEFPGGITVQNGARLFRVTYWTVLKGAPTLASGLLATPAISSPAKGLVLFLHGTNATRALAPSQADRVDGNEETAVFAGNGYVVALPDYIGLGASKIPQPYLIAQPQLDASIDLLRAVGSLEEDWKLASSHKLFMMGFSQGGQVVAAVHRALERSPVKGFDLMGSVGIAGPYDLRKTSLPKAIENNCLKCVGYLTWASSAYAAYYGHPLSEALRPPYDTLVPQLFDGSKTAVEIGSALPDDPADVFQADFLTAMRNNGNNWFTSALAENETFAWIPVAPFRLYFGENDVDVPPSSSKAFFDYAKPRGGNVSLHALPNADHQESSAMTYAPTLRWFDELSEGR